MTADITAFATPLTPDHARQLDDMVATLSRDEVLWVSGYLAGLARQQPLPLPQVSADRKPPQLTILYGSETGHAAALAGRMETLARNKGMSVRCIDMADFRPQELKNLRHLVVLSSTHGDGDPPAPAAAFHEFLHGRKAPRLEDTKFAVLGLGDSSYEHFCQTAKDFDRRLEELGATRLHIRADCDVDYEDQAAAWMDAVLTAFAEESPNPAGSAAVAALAAGLSAVAAPAKSGEFDRQSPFSAPILESLVLNGRGSDKVTRHIELSLAGSGLAYEPGDSLAVAAENDPTAVREIIGALGISTDEEVAGNGRDMPLAEALARHYEITTLTPRFLEAYAEVAEADKLRALLRPDNRAELKSYIAGRQIIDVISEFPIRRLGGQAFVSMLRGLRPRLYSIASSLAAFPDEAHITVTVVSYRSHGRARHGVASTFLAERRDPDDTISVYVQRNKKFRLPPDGSTPIIMVGAGTGVAPFRAFMQEREARQARGQSWLFFGDRRFRTDFLYQVEWQRLLKEGRLSRMDVAFSREQDEKVYVQHRLREQSRDIYGWLEEGAHFYVCGDASRLAPDVHATLIDIVAKEGAMGREPAEDYVRALKQENRYQRDVY